MDKSNVFAINRIIRPNLSLEEYLRFTIASGLKAVELRNDLIGGEIIDGIEVEKAKVLFEKSGVSVLTINAVQKFNLPSQREVAVEEIKQLLMLCGVIGCAGLVLCPNNDTADNRDEKEMIRDTTESLRVYGPLFEGSGVTGLVEPLGFRQSSLRHKATAIEAIEASGYSECYKVVHDTFHHALGGEKSCFPEYTGMVHISGVICDVPFDALSDEDRVLIDKRDVIRNREQVQLLLSEGYADPISFEPFSSTLHQLEEESLIHGIQESMKFLTSSDN